AHGSLRALWRWHIHRYIPESRRKMNRRQPIFHIWRGVRQLGCTALTSRSPSALSHVGAIKLQTLQRYEIIVQLAELLCSLPPLPLHAKGQVLCEHSI